jgi:hypothetical protein
MRASTKSVANATNRPPVGIVRWQRRIQMSELRIEGLRRPLIINPLFNEKFVALTEAGHHAEHNISDLISWDPLIGESSQNNEIVRALALGLIVTKLLVGLCMLRHDGLDTFHFGNVDMLDVIAADGDVDYETGGEYILLQYELEDVSDDDLFKECVGIYDRAVSDLGKEAVYNTMVDLFADNTKESTERLREIVKRINQFHRFQVTGKDVPNVAVYSDVYGESDGVIPGRVYDAEDGDHPCGLVIQSTNHWPNDNKYKNDGAWYLIIENMNYQSDELQKLELELFIWAESAGWITKF